MELTCPICELPFAKSSNMKIHKGFAHPKPKRTLRLPWHEEKKEVDDNQGS